MSANRFEEVELKLVVQPEDLAVLWRHPRVAELTRGPDSIRVLDTVYFDTADLDLARSGLVLRVRRDGAFTVQTVKTRAGGAAGLFRRTEWETPISGEAPEPRRIPDRELRERVEAVVGGEALTPILRTQVQRSSRTLAGADWEATFDLDVGEAKTPKGSLPICELELELVSGDPASLYDLALELQASVSLRPASLGKVEAGLAVLLGESPRARRVEPLKPVADATLEDVMSALFWTCLDQIVANEASARAAVDPEGVHQLRVGARRLRSALSLFGDALPHETRQQFRAELRWLAGEFSDARDLDVFLADTLEPILARTAGSDELLRLEAVVREMRTAAYVRGRAALDSRRYARLVLSLGAWLAGRRWRDQSLTPESARLFAPAREGARQLLSRLYDKARERGAGIGDLSSEEAHRLRIQLKKLRYACEALCGLYPRRHAPRFVKRLRKLQDTLGHLNDQSAAKDVLDRALAAGAREPGSGVTPWSAGFVAGWTSRVALERLRPLAKAWKAFIKLDPFWLAK